jgi:glycosyltransferase involved in cell wall biosynthesis
MPGPLVSVVVPTCNRPDLLARLLRCIAQQSCEDFECLVIDDGSSADTLARYDAIWRDFDGRFTLHLKPKDERVYGCGRSRNRGLERAQGRFVAFCDDDDLWVRPDHLSASTQAMVKHGADLFFANMQCSTGGAVVTPNLHAPPNSVLQRQPLPGESDMFEVSRKRMSRFLMQRNVQSDTLVVAKPLFDKVGQYWEDVWGFPEDNDMIYRLADRANRIIYRSSIVADLNVSRHASIFQSRREQDRMLLELASYLGSETLVADKRLQRAARANRAWHMITFGDQKLREGQRQQAVHLAAEGFLLHPSLAALRVIARSLIRLR